ncbi:hypothetical protein GCM10022292_03740 [Winogradskyella damuponensis]|uniref:Uncharacterized protein n=1 Tax=Winogradskyella damuponensis TaxID=943939 RepID=A0ABP8CKX8_9FLAO
MKYESKMIILQQIRKNYDEFSVIKESNKVNKGVKSKKEQATRTVVYS